MECRPSLEIFFEKGLESRGFVRTSTNCWDEAHVEDEIIVVEASHERNDNLGRYVWCVHGRRNYWQCRLQMHCRSIEHQV